jgi:hypothetical protein
LMGEVGQSLAPAMFALLEGQRLPARRMVTQAEHGGCREGPREVGMADLRFGTPIAFHSGFLGALHQAVRRDERPEPWEAMASMDVLPQYQGEDLADAWERAPPGEGAGLVELGHLAIRPLHVAAQVAMGLAQGSVHCDTLLDRRRSRSLRDASPIGLVGDVLADGGQIGLAVRMLDVGEEHCPFAPQMHAAPEHIMGGVPLGGIDRGLREHPAAEQHGDLRGLKPLVLRLAPMNGLHSDGVAQDEGHPLVGAEVGESLLGEDAFATDNKIFPRGGRSPGEMSPGLPSWLRMPSSMVRACQSIPSQTCAVRCNIALRSPPRPDVVGPTPAVPRWYAEEGASISIMRMQSDRLLRARSYRF